MMYQFADETKVSKGRLSDDFRPTPYTVLCGRGKDCFNYMGNRRFRIIVDLMLERYSLADTKTEKSRIVSEVVQTIRSSGGAFAKFEKGAWWEVGDAVAREKVGALFRDCLHMQYRSSAKAKTARRRANQISKEILKAKVKSMDEDDETVVTECSLSSASASDKESHSWVGCFELKPRSSLIGAEQLLEGMEIDTAPESFAV